MADIVEKFLEAHGEKLVYLLDKHLPRTVDASGNLRKSIRFVVRKHGIDYTFSLYLADYYKAIDEGQKAGTIVSVRDLLDWIKVKRLVIYEGKLQTKKQGSKLKKISDDRKKALSVAFAIRRKIFDKGTKGTGFFSDTVPDWAEEFKRSIGKAFGDQIKADIRLEVPLQTKITFG